MSVTNCFGRSGPGLVLGGRGIDVRGQAGNGREAIVLMRELDPDVVLMEIRMSVMDGVAATRKLTRFGVRAVVPVITAGRNAGDTVTDPRPWTTSTSRIGPR